jgi:beta-lactamase class A
MTFEETHGERARHLSESAFWDRVRRNVERSVEAFDGVAGVTLVDLTTDRRLEVHGDMQFPTASTIKIHLLAVLEQLHHDGALDLNARVEIVDTVPESGVLGCLDDTVELSWRDVANLMIIASDNTATNMIIDLIGFERIAEFFNSWNLKETTLKRKMQDHVAVAAGIENLASPRDMVRVLKLLWSGVGFGAGVADECLRVLKKPKKSSFRSSLPPHLVMANKPGALARVRCEVGIIFLPRRPFALAVMTKYGPVESEGHARWVSDVARTMYDAMAVLDATSMHGQGVLASNRTA